MFFAQVHDNRECSSSWAERFVQRAMHNKTTVFRLRKPEIHIPRLNPFV